MQMGRPAPPGAENLSTPHPPTPPPIPKPSRAQSKRCKLAPNNKTTQPFANPDPRSQSRGLRYN